MVCFGKHTWKFEHPPFVEDFATEICHFELPDEWRKPVRNLIGGSTLHQHAITILVDSKGLEGGLTLGNTQTDHTHCGCGSCHLMGQPEPTHRIAAPVPMRWWGAHGCTIRILPWMSHERCDASLGWSLIRLHVTSRASEREDQPTGGIFVTRFASTNELLQQSYDGKPGGNHQFCVTHLQFIGNNCLSSLVFWYLTMRHDQPVRS